MNNKVESFDYDQDQRQRLISEEEKTQQTSNQSSSLLKNDFLSPESSFQGRDSITSDRSSFAEGVKERRKFKINQQVDPNDREHQFCSNAIRTSKYTMLNFVPLNLLEQFTKMANAYFFLMFLLQLIPGIGTQGGAATTIMPLAFVVGISMIKDAFEDRKRRQ